MPNNNPQEYIDRAIGRIRGTNGAINPEVVRTAIELATLDIRIATAMTLSGIGSLFEDANTQLERINTNLEGIYQKMDRIS
jgi:hypothetical protein